MNKKVSDDVVELIDVVYFVRRQAKFVAICFVSLFLPVLLYLLLQPPVYRASVGVQIGDGSFLSDGARLIESVDEVEYRLAGKAAVSRIGNSNIVNIVVVSGERDKSTELLASIVLQLIDEHKLLLDKKRSAFVDLLRATGYAGRLEYIKALDQASSIAPTRQIGVESVKRINFGDNAEAVFSVGLMFALVVSIFSAFLRDVMSRHNAAVNRCSGCGEVGT
ncbi:hypothetical protein [Pseudomonas urmiensis]|uniref:hypothetical protein n=1 Tax=Pseudomonas urmiensis TaxID=2745493 RepID=UPI003D0BEA7A